jgi:D-3-phosphoglycerate dehydrogenase / 2-oxoglutarate reductase
VAARILVLGDRFCPSAILRDAFRALEADHRIDYADVVDEPGWAPSTASERVLREVMGSPRQVIDALDGHDILVMQGAAVSDAVFDADPALALVCCARGGPVNVDLAAATERGIPVVTTPGKNADAVAELTIGFLVMLARRLAEVIRHVEGGGEFAHDNYEGANWFGHDLAGKTLGLVGYGQVGRRVAQRARAFGMRVVVFDPFVAAEAVAADGAEHVELATLLRDADAISLHARATTDNRGLIGRDEIAQVKRGALLVNTARDTLLDEGAVIEGLRSGRLGGLAVDVVSPSPREGRHPLLAFPNVIVTTHIGGATIETLRHGGEMAAAEIARFLRGEPLVNVANGAALAARGSGGGAAATSAQGAAAPSAPNASAPR